MNKRHILATIALTAVTALPMTVVLLRSSAQFIDDTQIEFDSGVYIDTQFDAGNSWVELDANGLLAQTGTYTSAIFDAGLPASWDTVSWIPNRPSAKPIPNNGGVESVYAEGNVDATNSELLLHADELTGSTTEDDSGNTRNFSCTSCPAISPNGIIDGAFSFSGGDALLDDDGEIYINGLSAFSLGLWVKSDVIGTDKGLVLADDPSGSDDIFGIRYDNAGASGGGDDVIKAGIDVNGSTLQIESSSFAQTTDWQHLVLAWESGGQLELYINGQLDTPTFISPAAVGVITGATKLFVGKGGKDTAGGSGWDGLIDEVVLFDTRLNATEVFDLYTRGAQQLSFQVRSCDDAACVGETFIGPDGTAATFYEWGSTTSLTTPSFGLTNVSDNQYFQYRATFDTESTTQTPELTSVQIDFTTLNNSPDQPVNADPADLATNTSQNPTITASTYNDPEIDAHTNTQWQVDDNSDFSSIDWQREAFTGEETTMIDDMTGTFASELTGRTKLLPTGTYYWRVRYQDSNGNWSAYSTPTSFTTKEGSSGGGGGSTNIAPSNPFILINEGDSCTTNTAVTLELSAEGASTMFIGNDEQLIDSVQVPYNTSYEWELPGTFGEFTVYALFKANAGAPSTLVSDSIEIKEDCPVDIEEETTIIEETPEVEVEPSYCSIGCNENTYIPFIINPDGTRRNAFSSFAEVHLFSQKSQFKFEDKGEDFDYNDVVVTMNTVNCPEVSMDVLAVNANWDHQIGVEIWRDSKKIDEYIFFESSQFTKTNENKRTLTFDASSNTCSEEPTAQFMQTVMDTFKHRKERTESFLKRIFPF